MTEFKKTNYIKIQDGCSQKCGYCVVREFRGPSVSESYENIAKEVKYCVEECGMKILQLEGVNSIEYQHESVGDIIDLCKKLVEDFPNTYFMIGQVNPFDINKFKKLMEFIGSNEHMIKTCLVPIQSASNTALARMHRPHTKEGLRELLAYAKDCGVDYTVEIIPGFPGETEEEFMDTYNFLNETPLVAFYTHAYSRRPGTEAASLPDQIPEEVVKVRMDKYSKLQKEISKRFKQYLIDKETYAIYEPAHGLRTIHNIKIKNDVNMNETKVLKVKVLNVAEDGKLEVEIIE